MYRFYVLIRMESSNWDSEGYHDQEGAMDRARALKRSHSGMVVMVVQQLANSPAWSDVVVETMP